MMTLYWARLAAVVNGVSDGPAFGYCGSQMSTSKFFLRPSSWIMTSASSIAGWRNEPSACVGDDEDLERRAGVAHRRAGRHVEVARLAGGRGLRDAEVGRGRRRPAMPRSWRIMSLLSVISVLRASPLVTRAEHGRAARSSLAIAPTLSPASLAVLASAIFARRLVTVAAGIVPAVPHLASSASRSAIDVVTRNV